ncbi:MAG: bifunctional glutamate N-acetyltransferase/amino-acid acetyltransferase ArgJ [Myxococcales bacterium]|nr:bifunctional glutamate N-acetyltransferase/amino-acid acetyltransferase ArgJ [Myxococcales bacterium]
MTRQSSTPYVPEPAPFGLAEIGGLRAAGVAAGIKKSGAPDVALLVAAAPVPVAGVFTTNAFAAAPVDLSREHLDRTGGHAAAIVVNSGNANACTGDRGKKDARAMAERTARLVGCLPEEVLVCSTGVIGVPLPLEKVLAGIERAYGALAQGPAASSAFGDAIRTTDAFPKAAAREIAGGEGARVAGVCKGAGMIEPNMATMLAFIATDLAIAPGALREIVARAAARSFNAVHVDTHASTNDTFLVLASSTNPASVGSEAVATAITDVARRLAWLIARDGEGATKVTTIRVSGAADDTLAREVARRVASSALVRTALFGCDPNWGRFVSAAGNHPRVDAPSLLTCSVQGTTVFQRGEPTGFDHAALRAAMGREDVVVSIDLGSGTGEAEVMTSDLGYRYVEVNAEYTT